MENKPSWFSFPGRNASPALTLGTPGYSLRVRDQVNGLHLNAVSLKYLSSDCFKPKTNQIIFIKSFSNSKVKPIIRNCLTKYQIILLWMEPPNTWSHLWSTRSWSWWSGGVPSGDFYTVYNNEQFDTAQESGPWPWCSFHRTSRRLCPPGIQHIFSHRNLLSVTLDYCNKFHVKLDQTLSFW